MKAVLRSVIIITLILSFTGAARSQQLSNTYWIDYDSANTLTAYWHFYNNSLLGSTDNITYHIVSDYIENGNMFKIVDVFPSGCTLTDTGYYTFLIQFDTLRFTFLSDTCTPRSDYLTTHYFVPFFAAIKNEYSYSPFRVLPNPFNDQLKITGVNEPFQITLYDITGRAIIYQPAQGTSLSINTSQLAKGIYFYEVRSNAGKPGGLIEKGKVVKE